MSHQPFESWMLDEIRLSLEQEKSLQAHLETCPECRALQVRWQAARDVLKTTPMARPAPGFSQRFSASLAERRARQAYQRQVRNLIVGLSLGLVASIALLIAVIFTVTSPVDLLVRMTEWITTLISWWNRASRLLLTSLQQPVILAFWILLTSGISLLVFGWLFTLWRISLQGAQRK